MKRAKRNG
jgi:hypothetical protein